MKKSLQLFGLLFMASFIFTACNNNRDDDKSKFYDEGVVINGIRWATRNVDAPGTFARNPESAGRFYQWGTLSARNAHWPSTGTIPVENWNVDWDRTPWTIATDPCPEGWRVPTEEELRSLNRANSIWTTRNGVNGRLFGTEPNQIFLPAAGSRFNLGGGLRHVGEGGRYWSRYQGNVQGAWHFYFGANENEMSGSWSRAHGMSIRCVAED